MPDVHQRPHCELEFLNTTELGSHRTEDHAPVDVDVYQEERPDDGSP